MTLIVLRAIFILVFAGGLATFVSGGVDFEDPTIFEQYPLITFISGMLLAGAVVAADVLLRPKRIEAISAIYFGIVVGVILTILLVQAIRPAVPDRYEAIMTTLLALPTVYLCVSLLLQTRNDFRFVIPYVEFVRELKGGTPLLLDSSALIDGRIADVTETHLIDSELIVPQFVLLEVQEIADSSDKNRRARGRRGLEVLARLQSDANIDARVLDTHEGMIGAKQVDSRLVDLAKELSGRIVTNDLSLQKVASLQGVACVNLNDVANALKPRFLPGDQVRIRVIKDGESPGQGVGYLDDGTMVVCENAAKRKGEELDIIVTSVLQSSGGRMLFGRDANEPE
ncbi:PIN/TRAM domain-containing protein [Stratiformator vulcanicus]|uniref:Putative PIN and TRAM-domain containing protein n=1 Tax=Stratiformator vulcanicus TaxID=2527980 RepID=A0A517QZU5_9PLAN|nr:TRAM domain-containing protein [Stratiformator vulcanicus]QDT37169.1 putative PIN and TRAM-domain containing protein precursor [Stratiformator vulcanicus]